MVYMPWKDLPQHLTRVSAAPMMTSRTDEDGPEISTR